MMKSHTTRFLSLVLALVLSFSLCVPAFAAESSDAGPVISRDTSHSYPGQSLEPYGGHNYFIAVPTCYQLGVLTGTGDGCFHGEQTMTRAQACAVIVRMMDVIGDPPSGGTHSLVVAYVDKDTGRQLGSYGFSREIQEGQPYSFTSDVIPGYTTDRPVVSGVMGRCDRFVTVEYTAN